MHVSVRGFVGTAAQHREASLARFGVRMTKYREGRMSVHGILHYARKLLRCPPRTCTTAFVLGLLKDHVCSGTDIFGVCAFPLADLCVRSRVLHIPVWNMLGDMLRGGLLKDVALDAVPGPVPLAVPGMAHGASLQPQTFLDALATGTFVKHVCPEYKIAVKYEELDGDFDTPELEKEKSDTCDELAKWTVHVLDALTHCDRAKWLAAAHQANNFRLIHKAAEIGGATSCSSSSTTSGFNCASAGAGAGLSAGAGPGTGAGPGAGEGAAAGPGAGAVTGAGAGAGAAVGARAGSGRGLVGLSRST
jgi:hypothetical protein